MELVSAAAPCDSSPVPSFADCTGLVVAKRDGDRVRFVPVLCGQWQCGCCGRRRAAWLVRNITVVAREHELTRMMTLTLSTRDYTAEQSFLALQLGWRRLRSYLGRHYPGMKYVWVLETTKRGQAHLHVLCDRYLPRDEMVAVWKRATGGSWMVDIRRVSSGQAAGYVSKYVGKQLREGDRGVDRPLGAHVFGKSQGIAFSPFEASGGGGVVIASSWEWWVSWCRRNCSSLLEGGDSLPWVDVAWSEVADQVHRSGFNGKPLLQRVE